MAEGGHLRVGQSPERRRKHWALLVICVLLIGGLDQATKYWAASHLPEQPGNEIQLYSSQWLQVGFHYVTNTGAAWGFLADKPAAFRRPFFIGISLLALTLILTLFARVRPPAKLMSLGLMLLMAGAIGNFIDRLRFSYVIDFIDLHFWSFRWPTFNVADVAISAGVGLLLLDLVRLTWIEFRRPQAPPAE